MKILETKIPSWVNTKIECKQCGTCFILEETDWDKIKLPNEQNQRIEYNTYIVACPTCGLKISFRI